MKKIFGIWALIKEMDKDAQEDLLMWFCVVIIAVVYFCGGK